jgi:hypothetical protein
MRVLSAAIALVIGVGGTAPVAHSQEFHGYACTDDCSGHRAGYAWAERHDITDPGDCGGNSQSFIEGCQAYAEEHEDDGSNDDDCDEEDSDDCDVDAVR